MIFSSLPFLLFWAAYLLIIKNLKKFQLPFLVLASVGFYSYSDVWHTVILLSMCLLVYAYARYRFNFFILCVLVLAPLAYFKYAIFFMDVLGIPLTDELSVYFATGIPIGLSFVTFSLLALAVAVRNKEWEKISLMQVVGYIFYFPQLIAGPIVRPHQLIPQIIKKFETSASAIKSGVIIFCLGFVKKIYIADTLALMVDPVFASPASHTPAELLTAALLFSQQIYFDFSGYSSMAIGIALTLGVKLPENFDRPYLCHSITHFWQHWHMTLSAWVRDFIYIPLGGNRFGNARTAVNIVFAMILSGLWHGAGVGFILWGALHGLVMAMERFLARLHVIAKVPLILKIILTCIVVFNLWILFRIEDFADLFIFGQIYSVAAWSDKTALTALGVVILLVVLQRFDRHDLAIEKVGKINSAIVYPMILVIVVAGMVMAGGSSQKFIYFDF